MYVLVSKNMIEIGDRRHSRGLALQKKKNHDGKPSSFYFLCGIVSDACTRYRSMHRRRMYVSPAGTPSLGSDWFEGTTINLRSKHDVVLGEFSCSVLETAKEPSLLVVLSHGFGAKGQVCTVLKLRVGLLLDRNEESAKLYLGQLLGFHYDSA